MWSIKTMVDLDWCRWEIANGNLNEVKTHWRHIAYPSIWKGHGSWEQSTKMVSLASKENAFLKTTMGRTGISPFIVHLTCQMMSVKTDNHCWRFTAFAIMDWLFTPSVNSSKSGLKITFSSSQGWLMGSVPPHQTMLCRKGQIREDQIVFLVLTEQHPCLTQKQKSPERFANQLRHHVWICGRSKLPCRGWTSFLNPKRCRRW